ncbi:MAG: hypothetical protein JWQ71_3309 [Pedosphaera sp.]|nr:hypothetical protein [Pedosphaera sp.]
MLPFPKSVEDEAFGLLEWDEEIEWFSGTVEFKPDIWIKITFLIEKEAKLDVFLQRTREQYSNLQRQFPKIYDKVRDEFLKLYNGNWSEVVDGLGQPVGRGRISSEQFDQIVCLESIGMSDGGVELWFYDNNELFGGHSIRVALNTALEIIGSGLEG